MRRFWISMAITLGVAAAFASSSEAGWKGPIIRRHALFDSLALAPNGDTHFFYHIPSGNPFVTGYDLLAHLTIDKRGHRRTEKLFGTSTRVIAAVDSQNNVHFVYSSPANGVGPGLLWHGYFDGTEWTAFTIPGSLCGTGASSGDASPAGYAIAVDAQDHPVVACLGPASAGGACDYPNVTVFTFDGTNWTSEIAYSARVDPTVSCLSPGFPLSLGAASDGSIHVSFLAKLGVAGGCA